MLLRCDSQHIEQCFASESALVQTFGSKQASVIRRRISELRAAPSLADIWELPQLRTHKLDGAQDGKIAVAVGEGSHLVFTPLTDAAAIDSKGEIDWIKVTEISVSGIMKLPQASPYTANA